MGDFNLYRRFRNVETGRVSNSFMAACSDSKLLHLRPGYIAKSIDDLETPFVEIESVPYDQCFPKHHKELFVPRQPRLVSLDDSITKQYDLLKSYILDKWDNTKYNVLLHSSGYDSRILSLILREIYESGKKLGKFAFLCHSPEGDYFKKVMEAEGWDPEYWTINAGSNESFDFSRAWEFLNGPSDFPICPESVYFYRFYGAKKTHMDDFRLWFGAFGNEVFYHIICRNKTYRDMCDIYYYSRYARFFSNFNPDNIRVPFLDPKRLEYVLDTSIKNVPSDECVFKTGLLARSPIASRLKDIAVYPPDELSKSWHCPESIFGKAVSDYEDSWYYKNVGDDGYRDRFFGKTDKQNLWWSNWTLASLCDAYIKRGWTIKHDASAPVARVVRKTESSEQFWNRHTVHDKPFTTREESESYNSWLYGNYKLSRDLLLLDEPCKDHLIMDYGCGPGNDTIEFAKKGARVMAVDISEMALNLAKGRAKLYDFKNIIFQKIGGDGKVVMVDGCADRVHCNGVLHHIPNPQPQIDEIYRLLRPGGYATLMVYNRESIFYHLYVAYVLRFLSSEESGIVSCDDFDTDQSTEQIFSQCTDGKDCPHSEAYGREFMDLLHGKVFYAGAFYCSTDQKPFFDKYYGKAIREPLLARKHKTFLGSLEWRGNLPYKDGMPCGSLAVYYMTKLASWG